MKSEWTDYINLYSELCALNSLVSIRYLKKNHYGEYLIKLAQNGI